MITRVRILAAAVVAAATLAAATAPAGAQNGGLADTYGTTTTTTTAPEVRSAPGGLEGRYSTLTAAMLSQWAQRTGADVDDLIGPHGEVLAGTLGRSSVDDLRAMGVGGLLGDLDATISKVTLGVSGTGVNFDRLARTLPTMLSTPDGATIAAGVYSARTMAQLEVPDLTSPGLLANAAPLDSIGPDSLTFGLFLNQSLTSLAQTAPDVFASVLRRGGLADPSANKAWAAARQNAADRLAQGFSGDLMNPCLAVLVSSIASGDTSGVPALTGTRDGCRPCAVAGSYMGGQLTRVLNGDVPQRLIIPDDGVVTDYEWFQIGEAGRNFYYEMYPGLREVIESQAADERGEGSRQRACAEAQAGTKNFLGSHSAGILGRLGG